MIDAKQGFICLRHSGNECLRNQNVPDQSQTNISDQSQTRFWTGSEHKMSAHLLLMILALWRLAQLPDSAQTSLVWCRHNVGQCLLSREPNMIILNETLLVLLPLFFSSSIPFSWGWKTQYPFPEAYSRIQPHCFYDKNLELFKFAFECEASFNVLAFFYLLTSSEVARLRDFALKLQPTACSDYLTWETCFKISLLFGARQ